SIFSFGFIGIEKEYRGRAHSDVTILNGMEIIEELDGKLDYDSGYRYKDFDNLMIENMSLFTKLPSTSTWIYSNEEQVNSYTKLGYSQLYMRLNNTNGTILSDSILGMKYVLTQKRLDERIYNYISETNTSKIKLYEFKEYLPIGIVYDKNKDIEEIPPNMNYFEYQNWIYKNLFDKSSNIFECINPIIKSTNSQYLESENIIIEDKNNSENAYVEYEVTMDKPEILYFFTTDDLEKGSICIEVNGELLNISSTNDLKNIYYPASYNNGILNLGYYDNEIVKIKIYFWDNINLNYLKFAKFDYSKYKELCKSKIDTKYKCDENIITIETNVEKDKKIFIPITYDKNWKAILNGQQVSVQKALGGMISVELEEGYNEIKLIYTNSLIKIGAIITVISIMLFIILDKFKDKILNLKILNNIFYYAFVIVSVILIIYVYFWGLISTFL
ncbi:MAG: YfhO family protein, partial [Clostridia bacterium]|nr:YfhO family protein [Clostridia bacterium]